MRQECSDDARAMTRLNVFILLQLNVQSYSFYFCAFVNLLLLVSYNYSFLLELVLSKSAIVGLVALDCDINLACKALKHNLGLDCLFCIG
jgi:hypothetical protein